MRRRCHRRRSSARGACAATLLTEVAGRRHEESMHDRVNDLGQPIGFALPGWTPPARPPREPLAGRRCRLEPVDPARHAADLFRANARDADGRGWTYLPYGPFRDLEAYVAWMRATCLGDDPLFFAIVDAATGAA